MLSLLAQWPFWVVNLLIVFFLAICVVMLLTILIQKPQGGGLSAAFGAGASSGQTAFGAKTGDALTIFTIVVFALYVIFASVLNWGARIAPPADGDAAEASSNDGKTAPTPESNPESATPPATVTNPPEAPATAPVTPAATPTPAPGSDAPATTPAQDSGTPAPGTPSPTPTPVPPTEAPKR
ncbi:MAG: preprotein translocase subunit SecG [Phycisphaerales bacterium]